MCGIKCVVKRINALKAVAANQIRCKKMTFTRGFNNSELAPLYCVLIDWHA